MTELPEQQGPESFGPSRRRRVLLPHEPERPVRLVSRPRLSASPGLNAYAGIASGAPASATAFEAGLINKACPTTSKPAATRSRSSSRTRSSSARDINTLDPTWSSVVQQAATRPGSLWYAHVYEPTTWTGRWELGPGGFTLPDPSLHPRVLRRHHAGQRHDLPAGHRPGAPLPPAAPQRLQRPVPQPAALCRRRAALTGSRLDYRRHSREHHGSR